MPWTWKSVSPSYHVGRDQLGNRATIIADTEGLFSCDPKPDAKWHWTLSLDSGVGYPGPHTISGWARNLDGALAALLRAQQWAD